MRDSRPRQTTGPADPGALRDTALQQLGLEPGSPLDDAAVAHDALVAFLATAPRSIHGWAHAQAMSVDAAYASLTETVVPAAASPDALVGGDATATARPGEQDRQPARRVSPPPVAAPTALSEEDRIEELLASVTPSHHRDSVAPAAPAAKVAATSAAPAPAASAPGTISIRIPGRRWIAAAGLVVALGVVAVVGYGFGGQTPAADASGQTTTADSTAGLDKAKVAELMTRIQANPNDADALLGVGDEYFQTGDYLTAADWFRKAATADPANVKALLALGAAVFNGGDLDAAEIQWSRAVELDPANVEGHYDLGFLYLNRDPADMAGMVREWNEVIRLAPDSEIAKTVKTHLDALQSPAPGASGAPLSSGEPAALGPAAPAITPAPAASAAPAASVQP